jgi:2-phosphosulfolactate phosphatase
MKINTLLSPLNVEELYFTKKTTIVIDVLRATTTITTALNNGAREIVPVNSIEFAMKVSGDTFSGQTLLAGERNAKKIDGFALGNSPLEFTKDVVDSKSIVFFTTNGSKAIVKAKYSSDLILSSFLNGGAVANHLKDHDEIVILCSGNNGLFSYDDSVCAGFLIQEINDLKVETELDDASKVCQLLYQKSSTDLTKMLMETEHGSNLIEKGFESDISYSAQKNILSVIPYYDSGSIKLIPNT